MTTSSLDVAAAAAVARPSLAKRLLMSAPARIVLGVLAIGLTAALSYGAASAIAPTPAGRVIWPHLLACALVTLVYVGYIKLFERRAISELALAGAAPQFGMGAVLGAGAVMAVMAVLGASGSYTLAGVNPWSLAIVAPLAEMLFAGLFEEILFRAVVFRILERSWGSWPALMFSAVLFSLAHLGEGISALGLLNTALAGLVFCAAYMLTRRLWLGIGIHAAWNYTLGSICSIAVSGRPAKGLMVGTLTGPDWLTGGLYGLEGSILTALAMVALFAGLYLRARRAGQVLRRSARTAH